MDDGYMPAWNDCYAKINEMYKENIDTCKQCGYYKECGGVWGAYLEQYGDVEIKDLAKKHILK